VSLGCVVRAGADRVEQNFPLLENIAMGSAAEYMQQSTECFWLSQQADESDSRFLYLLMAQAWIALARQVQVREDPYRSLEAELSAIVRKRVA
jgi:hypothetical protein